MNDTTPDDRQPADQGHHDSGPRIYVSAENDRINGRWIDATQDPDAIAAEVEEMLASFPGPVEWEICDYEGFGDVPLSGRTSFELVNAIALAIDSIGLDLVNAYTSCIGGVLHIDRLDEDTLTGQILDSFVGRYSSLADYAKAQAPGMCIEVGCRLGGKVIAAASDSKPILSEWPFNCIDWDKAATELLYPTDGITDVMISQTSSGVYVFNAY